MSTQPPSDQRERELRRDYADLLRRQRDDALAERDALWEALAELVRLKDGPRDDAYRAAKDAAWDVARGLVETDETQAGCICDPADEEYPHPDCPGQAVASREEERR